MSTVKQLQYRISRTKAALEKEKCRNNEKMARVGWGAGFRKRYTGPSCVRETELSERLKQYEAELEALQKGGRNG